MSIDLIFRGAPDTYAYRGAMRARKWFGLPNGKYYAVGCNDGGYKYVSVYPVDNHNKSSLESASIKLGIEIDPIELDIRERWIRLPRNFRSHIGIIGDRFRVIIVGNCDHFNIWRYYEFLKYGRLDLYNSYRNVELEKVA